MSSNGCAGIYWTGGQVPLPIPRLEGKLVKTRSFA
jgi:hypothetical protein